ncbi:MAG: hypothetical protein ACT6FG_07920, partial [Methanosarcinaceae archaeon]
GIRVVKCLSGVRRKSHAPFLEGWGSVTTLGYSTIWNKNTIVYKKCCKNIKETLTITKTDDKND